MKALRIVHRRSPWLLAVLPLVLLVACAASSPVSDGRGFVEDEGVPRNLVIELSIVRGPQAPPATGLPDRNGRWVLFPDGSLHYGERKELGADWLPGKTRTLTRPQMARFWADLEASGFADPDAGTPPMNFALLEPEEDGILYACAVSAGERRWAFVRNFATDDIAAPYAELARALGALAWVTDGPPRSSRIIPKRYDFGPDPYAPYRQP